MNSNLQNIGLLVLRAGMGLMMFFSHGLAKVLMLLSGQEIHFYNFLGLGAYISFFLAAMAEGVCSVLVILGLKARWAAIPVAFTMFIAGHVAGFSSPWARRELATLYLIGFLAIAIMGAGKFAMDTVLRKPKA